MFVRGIVVQSIKYPPAVPGVFKILPSTARVILLAPNPLILIESSSRAPPIS
nr:hypothetical protein [Thermodesulfovibrio sp. N1]